MVTLSPKDFAEKYGQDHLNMVNAVSNYHQNSPQEPGLFQRIGQDIQGAGEQVRSLALGEGENADKSVLNRATGMAGAAFGAVPKVASEFLPGIARKGLEAVGQGAGDVVNWLGNKLGDTQLAQNLVTKHPEIAKTIREVAGTAQNLGTISGTILGAGGVAGTAQAGIDAGANILGKAGTAASEAAGGMVSAVQGATEGIGGKISKLAEKPIPEQVQTALKSTSAKTFDEYAKVGKAATESFKNPTPLEMAGEKAVGVVKNIKEQINKFGKAKSDILEKVGETPAGSIARDTAIKLSGDIQKMGISLDEKGNIVTKAGRSSKISDPADLELIKSVRDKIVSLGDNPTIRQVDDTISNLQDAIYKKKSNPLAVKTNTEVGGLVEKTIGELNAKLKGIAGKDYADTQAALSERIGAFNELNKKLGSKGEKGGALMKRVFSPSDAGTKKLFAKVKELTGTDLVNEATMARFMMETFGDARQVSMLEKLQLPSLSNRGMLELAKDVISKKANTPEKILARARQLTNQ